MPVFRSSERLRCEECRLSFDPVYGGVCSSCRRLLCPVHLHGGVWRRLLSRLVPMNAPVCVRCREERRAAG